MTKIIYSSISGSIKDNQIPFLINNTLSGSYSQSIIVGSASIAYQGTGSFTGSFYGSADISGSFSGSFFGNGTGLTDISASSIIGLNLSRIASGSVTASIAPNTGLFVNTTISASSYSGSGDGLFNIPASGIVGLNLSQIASGSATASISPDKGMIVNTNLNVYGDVTAKNYIVSSSVLYYTQSFSSGSSRFGNAIATNTHQFTGSVLITGSLTATNLTNMSSSLSTRVSNIETSGSNLSSSYYTLSQSFSSVSTSYSSTSGSLSNRVTNVEITSSAISSSYYGLSSSLSQSIFDDATIIAFSSSYLNASASFSNSIVTLTNASGGFSVRITNLETTGSSLSGSYYSLSGSYSTLSGSYSTFSGSVSTRVTNVEATASAVSSSYYPFSASFSESIYSEDDITAFSSSYLIASASFSTSISALNNATSSYILNSQTASMSVLSSSYSLSSSYAETSSFWIGNILTQNINGINILIDSIDTGSHDACHWHYAVKNTTAIRTGILMATWINGISDWDEQTTLDVGGLIDVVFNIALTTNTASLYATTNGPYYVKLNRIFI